MNQDRKQAQAHFERAVALHACGQDDEAKRAYLDALECDPAHVGTLNNLGTLLFNGGYRSAARLAYRQAVEHHPQNAVSRVNYGNALYDNDETYQAIEQFQAALLVEPGCARAHRGLAYVYGKLGDDRSAAYHRDLGYTGQNTEIVPYRGDGHAIAVLLLLSALGGNVNTDRFLDDRTFLTTKLYAEYDDPAAPLPFHSFVFNAIGDADLCVQALRNAQAILARTNAPVINLPGRVLDTSRQDNADRLGRIPGVVAPLTRTFDRAALAESSGAATLSAGGFGFPLLVRTPGYHTGQHFVRVDDPAELAPAVAELPGERLVAMAYLDARGPDGNTRKYRVMFVDGILYPLHLAIARQWKVHYYTAQTNARPQFRAEESAFLADAEATLGSRAIRALEGVERALGLEYAGVDFALSACGEVLLFEANAAMVVPAPDPSPQAADRRRAAEDIFDAVRAMLVRRHRESLA